MGHGEEEREDGRTEREIERDREIFPKGMKERMEK